MDLLLHLIHKNKIDIYDIPIVEITDQYMAMINDAEDVDLDAMSDFLLMASTLLDIKCRMLLPKEKNEEGEEIDPREELIKQLLAYKVYKCMAQELRDMENDGKTLFTRKKTLPEAVHAYEAPVDLDSLLEDVTLKKLNRIFKDIMKRKESKRDPIRSDFGTIEKEEVTLKDKLTYVEQYASLHEYFSFRELLNCQKSRNHIIVTFLAVLELIKMGELSVSQTGIGEEIYITSQIA